MSNVQATATRSSRNPPGRGLLLLLWRRLLLLVLLLHCGRAGRHTVARGVRVSETSNRRGIVARDS